MATPNTKIDVSSGQCRDSNDIMDITFSSAITINAGANGAVNRLDAGTFAASKVYAVYAIGDSSNKLSPGGLLSLASNSAPTLPFGYDSYRLIGYAVSDASTHFLKAYVSGNNNSRIFTYDAYQATSVTAGTSATYAAIDLSALVPPVDQTPVRFEINWTANAAADSFNMQGANATGDEWTVVAPVAGGTAHTVAFGQVLAQLVSGAPKSNYKVSAVGGVAINVAGFQFFI
ncbi:MAG: hypothetical protein PHV62_03230 [Sulfuricurvum sp.]|nr:hypothetical protein [Sulfuricurvum sp.]